MLLHSAEPQPDLLNLREQHCSKFLIPNRPWIPYSGWPISRSELERWYKSAFDVLWLDESFYGESLLRRLGRAVPELRPGSAHVHAWQFAWVRRLGEVYLDELKNAENIRILLHANVVNIHTNGVASEVEWLDVRSLGGQHTRVK